MPLHIQQKTLDLPWFLTLRGLETDQKCAVEVRVCTPRLVRGRSGREARRIRGERRMALPTPTDAYAGFKRLAVAPVERRPLETRMVADFAPRAAHTLVQADVIEEQ